MKPLQLTKLSLAMSAAALVAACGGGSGDSSTPTGTLGVSLTDAPSCGFDAVNVTVAKVRVNQSATANENDGGWTDITLNPARKINLLNLTNGALENLGQTPLSAGHYSQLRLVLDANTGNSLANSVVLSGTTNEVSLVTPSAVQSGIKLVNEFDVAAGQRVDLVLDFNACKSIVTRGNGTYGLKPVINVIPTTVNGIDGFVNPALLPNHVVVTAQQNGTIIGATVPNSTTGEFFLSRLVPGNYDVVLTADNRSTAVIAGVPVPSTTSTTVVSSTSTPFNLAPSTTAPGSISGVITLNPSSATEVGYAAAKQSFSAGPTVTIKYQGADLLSGAYSLANLPTSAPQLGQYSATLPIALTTQTNTSPGTAKYAVQAAALGYAPKVTPVVDITTSNATGVNFTLTP